MTQLTKEKNDDEEEEKGSSRKQQKSACFALPWCVDFHALFTFPSVVSQVRGARPSVGPERAKRKLGGKTSRTSRVFSERIFGDRIFVLCGFLQSTRRERGEGVRENREQNFACCVNNSFPGGNSRDKGFPRVGPGGLA